MQAKTFMQMIKNLGGVISKNSPTILTGLSVAGLVTTAILGIKATPKAISVIEDHVWMLYEEDIRKSKNNISFPEWIGAKDLNNYSFKDQLKVLSKKEIIKLTWKLYLPMLAVGLTTIGCTIGSNHISLRRNAALASIYGLTEAAFKEYQAKVVETIGKNKELAVRDEISGDRIKQNPPGKNEIIFTGKGEVMCYDSLSGRYFKGDVDKIRKVVNELNRRLLSEMYIPLSEFYYEIGLANTELGDQLGWELDKGNIQIDFSAHLTENDEPCLCLNYKVTPRFL
jgi:hypothetical protein